MPSAVIAITGASGSQYSVRLIEALVDADWDIFLTVTREGAINLKLECDITPRELAERHGIRLEQNQNLAAKSASGSARFDAYVICPASGTTIGKIAAGISDNLATRSAIVAMKERRKLIIVPRETPMATPHLEALAKLSHGGSSYSLHPQVSTRIPRRLRISLTSSSLAYSTNWTSNIQLGAGGQARKFPEPSSVNIES